MKKYKKRLISLILSLVILFMHYNVLAAVVTPSSSYTVPGMGGFTSSQSPSSTAYVNYSFSGESVNQGSCSCPPNTILFGNNVCCDPKDIQGVNCTKTVDKDYNCSNTYTYRVEFSFKSCGGIAESVLGESITSWNDWQDLGQKTVTSSLPSKSGIEESACIAGENLIKTKTSGGTTYYTYQHVYSRCCAGSPAVAEIINGCYRNKNSTEENYTYQWGDPIVGGWDNPSDWVEIPEITSENDCVLPVPTSCIAKTSITKKVDKETNKCKDKVSVEPTQEKYCKKSGTFYNIECNHKVDTDFDPKKFKTENLPSIVSLKAGQGFEFEINVDHKIVCTGEFNVEKYKKAYTKASSLISRANKLPDGEEKEKEHAWAVQIRERISNIAISYLNYYLIAANENCNTDPSCLNQLKDYLFDYSGTLKYKYQDNKGNKNYSGTFILNDSNNNVKLTNQKAYKNNDDNKILINGRNNHAPKFEYTVKETTSLIPESVTFDYFGNIVTNPSTTTTTYSGGNKFYTDTRIKPGKYDISIQFDVTKGNQKVATIKNEQCDLEIYNEKLNYRIINNANPFVNARRAIGTNWLSSTYNFTNTIKSDTWSKQPMYTFNITKEKIADIKNSNGNDSDSYLGTCHKEQSQIDSSMKDICTIINSK